MVFEYWSTQSSTNNVTITYKWISLLPYAPLPIEWSKIPDVKTKASAMLLR